MLQPRSSMGVHTISAYSSLAHNGLVPALLPDDDEVRMLNIDDQALANLRPFGGQSQAEPHDGFIESAHCSLGVFPGPSRRHSTTSSPPGSQHRASTISSNLSVVPEIGRRSSTPSAARLRHVRYQRASCGSDVYCIIPKQLDRPCNPPQFACGTEIWWPIQSTGEVKIHVLISSRSGTFEKLTRCMPLGNLQLSIDKALPQSPSSDASRRASVSLPPGTMLPIPGSTPHSPSQNIVPSGRRHSWDARANPNNPRSPFSGRRAFRQDFPAECIDKECAILALPVLGSVLSQTKRPIHWDEAIQLPLPYPSAWLETVRYAQTRDPELLSEAVKRNVLHLGGGYDE